jgi:hypothetical protein
VNGDPRVGGYVDRDEFVAADLEALAVEEVDRPRGQQSLEARRRVESDADADVGRDALEHRLRLGERLPAPPPLHDARITGLREGVGAEVRADQHRVVVLPGDAGLGLGHGEAVDDELACRHVEFAGHRRVGAAPGEADQRHRVVRLDDVGACPHPLLVVRGGQLVEVEQDVPVGFVRSVALERGALPQSTRVLGVAPVVVEILAPSPHVRDPGVGVEDLECLGAHLLETLAAEFVERRFVVLLHPLERIVAGDVLEPQIRVCSGRLFFAHALITHSTIVASRVL